MDDTPRPEVRISQLGEVAAALPALIGFHPHESVLLVALGGESGRRVGLTVRADLPVRGTSAPATRLLARSVATDDPAAVVVAVVSEAPDDLLPLPGQPPGATVAGLPHRDVVHDAVVALADLGIPVADAILVRRGRWWSYDCPEPCCAPAAGTLLPGGVPELTVASVASGVVVERHRAALEERIARIPGPAAAEMEALTWRHVDRRARAAQADRDAEARRSWDTVVRVLGRCGPGGARLSDRDVARVVWALADVRVRDRALTFALGDDAAAAETLWTECTRRAPAPLDAAPATLLAVSAWLRGDGAMANVALERALESRPTYTFAQLLAQGLAACLPPRELRAMITATAQDPDEVWAAG
ncbi:DUF4192 domain-containing protein [Geodermatophilus sabuli]|uniref:DUF4192 domain-containing protein n=1 Tax=Geodermatophilus sabuli TaxID=1564158 RepID=A0A285EB39_9ACTN|nr:DUF4192 domain-containing protein [Geodermatophilus sabuli]MBB3085382.1 hypothetical protein [Geodermatophilus sabuli]SNX96190.1 protein of unknown function [Geodermatophilus sabuli]